MPFPPVGFVRAGTATLENLRFAVGKFVKLHPLKVCYISLLQNTLLICYPYIVECNDSKLAKLLQSANLQYQL